MFKISKSNKTSHKKLKPDYQQEQHYNRPKTNSYLQSKSSQNSANNLSSELKNSFTNFKFDKVFNDKLDKIGKGDKIVNVNLNVQIENVNLIQGSMN